LPARRGRCEVLRVIASEILRTGVDALEATGISLIRQETSLGAPRLLVD